MKINKVDLLKKGWTVQEVDHASKIIEKAEDKKHISIKYLDRLLYWALLALLVISNIVGAIYFLPFLFAFDNFFIIIITGVIGMTFGMLFSALIQDIKKIEHKRHEKLERILFISAIINFLLILAFARDFDKRSVLSIVYSPVMVGAVFFIAYLLPHAVKMYLEFKDKQAT